MFPDCAALVRDISTTSNDIFLSVSHPKQFMMTQLAFSFMYFCGFSCKSVSRCNEQSKNNDTCIADKTFQTGTVFKGAFDYIAKVHPLAVSLRTSQASAASTWTMWNPLCGSFAELLDLAPFVDGKN